MNGQVLVIGGSDVGVTTFTGAELYNPANDTWTKTTSMNVGRSQHTATLLKNGHVLVTGGNFYGSPGATAELYDPSTQTWSIIDAMHDQRVTHTASLLPNGTVLVTGGISDWYQSFNSTELYDPIQQEAIGQTRIN